MFMKNYNDDFMMVTIRVKQELSELYRITMIKSNRTMTDDLISHIENQVKNYETPQYNIEVKDKNYAKINFRIKRDLYTDYKVQMVKNRTTPTADITRHILRTIESQP